MRCVVCGSDDQVQRYALHVDGKPLRLQPDLCREHGDAFLIRAGFAMGEMFRDARSTKPGKTEVAVIVASRRKVKRKL